MNTCIKCGEVILPEKGCECTAKRASGCASATLLGPATGTPRTMRCWRNGQWQADELANLSAKLERENAELQATINTLHGLCVSAEKRAFKKIEEERAAAGPNDQAQRPGLTAGVERNETKGKSNE